MVMRFWPFPVMVIPPLKLPFCRMTIVPSPVPTKLLLRVPLLFRVSVKPVTPSNSTAVPVLLPMTPALLSVLSPVPKICTPGLPAPCTVALVSTLTVSGVFALGERKGAPNLTQKPRNNQKADAGITSLSRRRAEHENGVQAAEGEGVRHRVVHLALLARIRR